MHDGKERPALTWPGTGDALIWDVEGLPDAELPGVDLYIRWSSVFRKWVAEGSGVGHGTRADDPQKALDLLHAYVVERHERDSRLLRAQRKGLDG